MRTELSALLKRFLLAKLKEVKREKNLTQEMLSFILQVDRRTLAGVLLGEYSFGGLSVVLFFLFLVDDPTKELQELRNQFLEVLGEDWRKQVKKMLGK